MANPNQIPSVKVPVLGGDGALTLPWRLWAQNLTSGSGGGGVTPAEFEALAALVAAVAAEATTALANSTLALTAAELAELLASVNLGDTSGDVSTSPSGFGFFSGGLMSDNEALGTAVWGNPRTFSNTNESVARALYPASGNATITLNAYTGGGARYVAGTINFNMGTAGVISWAPTLNLTPGAPIEVNAPSPPDPTLASVRAMIYSG